MILHLPNSWYNCLGSCPGERVHQTASLMKVWLVKDSILPHVILIVLLLAEQEAESKLGALLVLGLYSNPPFECFHDDL